jgi:2-aminoadipate transaminase
MVDQTESSEYLDNLDKIHSEKLRLESLYSDNAISLKISEIRELLKWTQNPEVISFAGGLPNPEAFPIEEVQQICTDVIKDHGSSALQYGTTEGFTKLRVAIAERMNQREGLNITENNVLITTGSQQGLYLVSMLFTNPHDKIITGAPTYLGGVCSFLSLQSSIETVPLDINGMRVDLLEETLKKLDKAGHRVKFIYVIPTFQNPAGVSLSEERRKKVIELAAEYETMILADNPYSDLRYEGESIKSIKYFDDEDYVIYLGTFSKVLAPGLRCAWMIGSEELIRKCVIAKQALDLCTSVLSQYIAYEYINRGFIDPHIEKIKKIYKEKRDIMLATMDEYFPTEIEWTRPEGGLFTWVTCPSSIDTRQLFEDAIAKKVAFVYGTPFYPIGGGENTMRLNFSHATNDDIKEGIIRLAEVIKNALEKPHAKEVITGV